MMSDAIQDRCARGADARARFAFVERPWPEEGLTIMTRRKKIYEGKAKILMRGPSPAL